MSNVNLLKALCILNCRRGFDTLLVLDFKGLSCSVLKIGLFRLVMIQWSTKHSTIQRLFYKHTIIPIAVNCYQYSTHNVPLVYGNVCAFF